VQEAYFRFDLVILWRIAAGSTVNMLNVCKRVDMACDITLSGVVGGKCCLNKRINESIQSSFLLNRVGKAITGFDIRLDLIFSKSFFILTSLFQLIFER
jgi:hypothetical protein